MTEEQSEHSHTERKKERKKGQIYLPDISWQLMSLTIPSQASVSGLGGCEHRLSCLLSIFGEEGAEEDGIIEDLIVMPQQLATPQWLKAKIMIEV